MKTFSYERRLHWGDCDPAGIIFFPNYARWMVEGLNMMLLSLGVDPHQAIDRDSFHGIPSVGFSMSFHRPAKLHDLVTHEIAVEAIGRSSLSFGHRFLRGEDCLAEARDNRVWAAHSLVDASVRSVRVPDAMRALLS